MNPSIINEQQHHILFDSDGISGIVPQWFDIAYWQNSGSVRPASRGRGRAWLIESGSAQLVLRHYQRGGWMANVLDDKYLWTGLEQTRAWREWYLLAKMWQQGLPVPQPIAAHVYQAGLFYRADLITGLIPHCRSLSDRLCDEHLISSTWETIGHTIKKFHQAGVFHADLNAHNILINEANKIYLIDFDKGCIKLQAGQRWQQGNLQRLHHSLIKLKGTDSRLNFEETHWQALMAGYAN